MDDTWNGLTDIRGKGVGGDWKRLAKKTYMCICTAQGHRQRCGAGWKVVHVGWAEGGKGESGGQIHTQTAARKGSIPLLDWITVHSFLLLLEETYISLITDVRLGHYLSEPIKCELK